MKKTLKFAGICAGIYLLFILRSFKSAKAFFGSILSYWEWLKHYLQFADNFDRSNAIISIFLLCILITPAVFYFVYVRFNFYIILVSGLSIFVIQWIKGYFVSYSAFYIFIILLLVLHLLHIYKRYEANERSELVPLTVFLIWILPLCITVFILSYKISTQVKPLQITWLNRTLTALLDDINRSGPYNAFDYFTLAEAGFGVDSDLGGNVFLNNNIVMEVTSPRRVYLKGSSRDFYNGTAWVDSKNSIELLNVPESPNIIDVMDPNTHVAFEKTAPDNAMSMDYLEITEGIRLLEGTNLNQKLYYMDEVSVQYVNMSTRSLFIPLKTRMINYTHSKKPLKTFLNTSGVFSTDRKIGKNFRYSLITYTPRYSDENFKNLLRKSKKGLYSKYDLGLKVGVSVDTVKKLDKYAKNIYKIYTQLPSTLPDRVAELAYSISQPFDNNYDKVKAIENYLATNYTYTLLPGSTPAGQDFVDYFLFDLKQGYCTYYASAMVVMVRTLGIPARYVEGYILPPKSDSFSKYIVTNQQAHAWVEVYFEGFGWVTFEPTAPFNKAFYNKPKSFKAKFAKNFENDPTYRDYINQLKEYDKTIDNDTSRNILTTQILIVSAIVFSAIALTIMSIFLYNITVRKYRLRSVEKMKPRECIIYLMAYYMKIFSLLGLAIKTGETPSEYSRRISNILLYDRYAFRNESMEKFLERTRNIVDFHKQSKFMAVMDAFILARYNPGAVTEEHKKIVLAYYGQLMEKARVSLGRTRYFFYKYILGKFNFK